MIVVHDQTETLNIKIYDQMKTQSKLNWLIDWIKENQRADVLNSELVDEYEKTFNVKVDVMIFGTNRCKDLGKTLSYAYKIGLLKRSPVGLNNGAWYPGFPKWVYVYELK